MAWPPRADPLPLQGARIAKVVCAVQCSALTRWAGSWRCPPGGVEPTGWWRPVARTEEALLQRNDALRALSALPSDTPHPAH